MGIQLIGGVSSELAGVGEQIRKPVHVAQFPKSGNWYRYAGHSGTIGAALAASSELFQFRFVSGTKSYALLHKCSVESAIVAVGTAIGPHGFSLTPARAWSGIGTGGTRIAVSGDNLQTETAENTSQVNDMGIATTGALTAGTKTLDAVATFDSDGLLELGGDSNLVAVATLLSEGSLGLEGDAALQAVALAALDGSLIAGAEATFQAVALADADGLLQLLGDALLIGVATTEVEGVLGLQAEALLQAVGSLESDGALSALAESIMQAIAYLATDPDMTPRLVGWVLRGSQLDPHMPHDRRHRQGAHRVGR